MNKMYAISKVYGVVMDEIWEGNDGNNYILTDDGLFRKEIVTEEWRLDGRDLRNLVLGELAPVWEDNKKDMELMENGLVFETEEEAKAAGEELANWLDRIREDR